MPVLIQASTNLVITKIILRDNEIVVPCIYSAFILYFSLPFSTSQSIFIAFNVSLHSALIKINIFLLFCFCRFALT